MVSKTYIPRESPDARRDCHSRAFRRVAASAGLEADDWTPRELRHSFVSLLSNRGRVPIEEISRLVGHKSSEITELIYRHELRPVLQHGATVMDDVFRADAAT